MIHMELVNARILDRMSEDESFKNLSLKDSMRLVKMFGQTLIEVEMEDAKRQAESRKHWLDEYRDPEPEDEEMKVREAERERIEAEQKEKARAAERFYNEQRKLRPIGSSLELAPDYEEPGPEPEHDFDQDRGMED